MDSSGTKSVSRAKKAKRRKLATSIGEVDPASDADSGPAAPDGGNGCSPIGDRSSFLDPDEFASSAIETDTLGDNDDADDGASSEADDERSERTPKDAAKRVKTRKKKKPGVLYLATVPRTLTVTQIRSFMSQFGKVGRIFLQPDNDAVEQMSGTGRSYSLCRRNSLFCTAWDVDSFFVVPFSFDLQASVFVEVKVLNWVPHKGFAKGKRTKRRRFSEGWVEMEKKSAAKRIAAGLNNTRIGYKKRSPLYDSLWNLKYLSGFKWAHLNERLEYERQVKKQRMMNEVAQAKRETDAYAKAVSKSRFLKTKGLLDRDDSGDEDDDDDEDGENTSADAEKLENQASPVAPVKSRDAFLSSIFSKKKS